MKINKKKDEYGYYMVSMNRETWEKLKKQADKQLYAKYNDYADFKELRIYFNDKDIEVEGHDIDEKSVTDLEDEDD